MRLFLVVILISLVGVVSSQKVLKPIWKQNFDNELDKVTGGGFVFGDTLIIANGSSSISSLRVSDGKVLWRMPYRRDLMALQQSYPPSSQVIGIFKMHQLILYDISLGEELWNVEFGSKCYRRFVAMSNTTVYQLDANWGIYFRSKVNGSIVKQVQFDSESERNCRWNRKAQIYHYHESDTLVVRCSDYSFAINGSTGEQLWKSYDQAVLGSMGYNLMFFNSKQNSQVCSVTPSNFYESIFCLDLYGNNTSVSVHANARNFSVFYDSEKQVYLGFKYPQRTSLMFKDFDSFNSVYYDDQYILLAQNEGTLTVRDWTNLKDVSYKVDKDTLRILAVRGNRIFIAGNTFIKAYDLPQPLE